MLNRFLDWALTSINSLNLSTCLIPTGLEAETVVLFLCFVVLLQLRVCKCDVLYLSTDFFCLVLLMIFSYMLL